MLPLGFGVGFAVYWLVKKVVVGYLPLIIDLYCKEIERDFFKAKKKWWQI